MIRLRVRSIHRGWIRSMSSKLPSHAFTRNPLISKTTSSSNSPDSAFKSLKDVLSERISPSSIPVFKLLLIHNGRILVTSTSREDNSRLGWHIFFVDFDDFKGLMAKSEVNFSENSFVYLGSRSDDGGVCWAFDVSSFDILGEKLIVEKLCFLDLRTLMVATDWADEKAMEDLAIAGHAKSLLEWHNTSIFCGFCGEKTISMEAGRRRECPNESCKRRIYPRVDTVVIMLIIDRENDRALLCRQSRFVPRMWSCLAGFVEPGESLEEAVKRETLEEAAIEVGEVVYHSSQPWPVGPHNMPCQLMVGFFGYAESLEIDVDKGELEDAAWHTREEVKKALDFVEYGKAQEAATAKVERMCKRVEKVPSVPVVERGEPAPLFVPGPFAISHHLISSWAADGPSSIICKNSNL